MIMYRKNWPNIQLKGLGSNANKMADRSEKAKPSEQNYQKIATKIASILSSVGLESHPFKVKSFAILLTNKSVRS